MNGVLAARGSIGAGLAVGGGGAAFVGAYDAIPSIVAAYGMRRLRSAYTGSILRVRRSSDSAVQDIGYVSNGDLDTAAVAAFVGGGSGYIVTWYDQSGNGYDAVQTVNASQPLYVASGQNGRPVGRWDGTNDYFNIGIGYPTNLSIFVCAKRSNKSGFHHFVEPSTTLYQFYANSGANTIYFGNISFPNTIETTNTIILSALRSGTVGSLYTNGVFVAQRTIATTTHTSMVVGKYGGSDTEYLAGDIDEIIICNAALSTANRQAAEAAMNSYYAVY